MAARLRPRHQEDVKAKIQAIQLINLLQNHALTGFHNDVEVSQTRIDAAKFLLNKVIANPPAEVNNTLSGNLSIKWQQ